MHFDLPFRPGVYPTLSASLELPNQENCQEVKPVVSLQDHWLARRTVCYIV